MEKIGLFLGTERGYEVLKALISAKKNVSHVLVLEQQKHEINIFTNSIIELCEKNNIPYKTSSEVLTGNYEEYLLSNPCDVLFVVSWRLLIPENCFTLPKRGIFLLHDSLLPKYRGYAPTNWVIINAEKKTGLTLFCIHKDMDAGDIVDQIPIKIVKDETAASLNNKLLKLYPKIILKNIKPILKNTYKRKVQKSKNATYTCKRVPEDGHIDFKQSTHTIVQLIRGLTFPYPGAFCYYNDNKVIIWEAEAVKNPPRYVGRVPGKIVQIAKTHVDVLTADGIIRITKISQDGKDMINPSRLFRYLSKSLN